MYGSTGSKSKAPTSVSSTTSSNFRMEAQEAHLLGDKDSSKQIHQMKLGHANEAHLDGGDHIKSAVYGGLDGIITTFATVTSVAGSGLPHAVILILGIAHLIADGLSMGLGDYLSSQAEADLAKHERRREVWEFENYPEGEIEEMVELYEEKGISIEDARLVVNTLAKYKEAFIDIMMVEELGIMPVSEENPAIGGLITFASFFIFGSVPLLSYLINLIPGINLGSTNALIGSCVLTVITLFVLGAVKGKFVGQSWFIAGMGMAVNGSIAAASGWVIGYLLQLTGIQEIA